MKKERLQMLSDGVLAIIITLMVLEIKVPYPFTSASFVPVLQHIAIYALSFVVIAIYWLNYHHIFVPVEHVSIRITWINFMLLFMMSLIPLPTKALGENFFSKDAHLFYGIVLTLTAVFYSTLQSEVNKYTELLSDDERHKINKLNWTSTFVYGLSIPFSFVSIYLSTFLFILLPAIFFIPTRILRNKSEKQ
ncbi:MAG: DUF1211 domain-containing protein [Bacteroidetes bacterium]|nr:DUF1211 domain-containing protein [Bacteroidota bacterium]